MELGRRMPRALAALRRERRARGNRSPRHAAIRLAAVLVAAATATAVPSGVALAGVAGPPGSVPAGVNRAIGFASTTPSGATSIVVNVVSICPFVNAGSVWTVGSLSYVAGDFLVDGTDTGGAGTAGAVVAGQQTLTGLPPLAAAIPNGALVTQLNVPLCDRPTTPARLISLSLSAVPTSTTLGGSVTFTYTVTDPGGATLDGVGVTDPSCSPVSYVSGDTTPDGALEAGETWIFTCTTTLSGATLETAAASGTADGATSRATASTIVTVLPGPVTPPYIVATHLASASGVGVAMAGPFSSATKVPRVGQYAAVRWVLSPAQAHQLIGVEIATKRADGTWGPWMSLTSRLTDTSGVAYYFVKSSRPLWVSIRGRFAGTEHLAPSIAPAVQVHWR